MSRKILLVEMACNAPGQAASVSFLDYPQDALRTGGVLNLKHATTPAHPLEAALTHVRYRKYYLVLTWDDLEVSGYVPAHVSAHVSNS
jgi:hypothetical protein